MHKYTTDELSFPENPAPRYCFEIFEPASRDDVVIVDALVPRHIALRMKLIFDNLIASAALPRSAPPPSE